MSSKKTPACGAEYPGPPSAIGRLRKCDRPTGHPGVHREYITGVWWPNPPQPAPVGATQPQPCGDQYIPPTGVAPLSRTFRCDRPRGHFGDHVEADTERTWRWPNADDDDEIVAVVPEADSDDQAPDALDGMTPFELALALRFIAGFDPQVFARAVERVERHRAMLAKGV